MDEIEQFHREKNRQRRRVLAIGGVSALAVAGVVAAIAVSASQVEPDTWNPREVETRSPVGQPDRPPGASLAQRPAPVQPVYTPPSRTCCKVCSSKSKACGDSCISLSKSCHKGAGCACNAR